MVSITFYTNPMSRGQIARWILEETGQPYETVILDYGAGMKTPEYLSINPMGKVPAIVPMGRSLRKPQRSAPIWRTHSPMPDWRRRCLTGPLIIDGCFSRQVLSKPP